MMRTATIRNRVAAAATAIVTVGGLLFTAAVGTPAAEAAESGANVALARAGATVTASGQETADQWGPELAIDGVGSEGPGGAEASRWSSNHADDAWITVQLAEATVIDHIAIAWENACAASYTLQVSTDGETFTDASEAITPTCGTRDVQELTGATADTAYTYVRMQGHERTPIDGTKWGISLWEFEVWNGPEPVEVAAAADSLIPLPESVNEHDGEAPYQLASDSRIVADDTLSASADLLAAQLRGVTGFDLPVVSGPVIDGDIALTTGEVAGHAGEDEAYALDVGENGVTVTAATDHGAFNAAQTILQLFPPAVESQTIVETTWAMPAVSIVDAPRFAHRGIMLDSARSFLTVDEVKEFLDTMAGYKLSTLHFHIADDQGWRIEITNEGKAAGDPIDYSLLTEVSGATGMTHDGYKNELGHTGYYTQEDYSEIVQYAAARHITVIPEIDAPAHTNAALHAIPQLNTENTRPSATEHGTVPANGTGSVGYSTLDANAEITWTFMRHVLGQLAELTPGPYLHVGGDESHVTPHDDYVTFITKSVQIVHDLGKKMIGWNESAVGGVQEGDALQYWTGGTDNTLTAVKEKGAKLVISRGSSAYIDMKYNSKTPIGLTWAGTGDFPKYYNWDPAAVVKDGGANLPDEDILGVEAPMWSETIRGGEQAEFLAFPRAISIAEIGWTQQSQRDVNDFTDRMASVGQRLLAAGINFYDGSAATWDWSFAGSPVAVSPGRDIGLSVAQIAAPGTKASDGGTSIAVDSTDDADGVSASSVNGALTASVNWGDGSDAVPATFRTETARTSLSAGGLYSVRGTHAYAEAGTYTGTVTTSDGRTADFTVTVAEGTPDPAEPEGWDDSQTPTLTVDESVVAGYRLSGTLSGFEPGSYVTITVGDTEVGTVRPENDGTVALSLPIDGGAYGGEYTVTATSGERTASDSVIVDSDLVPLTDPLDQSQMSVVSVDSEETAGEDAAGTNAIDGDPSTFWHTQWQGGAPDYDHWIVLDLGGTYDVSGFAYTQRPGQSNGRMKGYELYVSDTPDGEWGSPVVTGELLDLEREQVIEFDAAVTGQYVKLVGTSSINGAAFGGAAEIVIGGVPHADAETPVVTVSPGTAAAGDEVTVSADGFTSAAPVTVSIASNDATAAAMRAAGDALLSVDAVADAEGHVDVSVTIPADASAGEYTVTVAHEELEASASLQITAADAGGDGPGTGEPGDGDGSGDGTDGDQPGDGGADTDEGSSTADQTDGSEAAQESSDSGNAELPYTGASAMVPSLIALLLLISGAGVVLLRRRRNTARTRN